MPRITPSKLEYDSLVTRLTSAETSLTSHVTDFNNGVTMQEGIDTLSSPSQLKHGGFYVIGACASDLGIGFTDWQVGDFHAILIGFNGSEQYGCNFGNLLIFSPRLSAAFWSIQIWSGAWGSAKKFS